jgi:ubiquinone/menaquinone biosynthesis C-methylase UbiE
MMSKGAPKLEFSAKYDAEHAKYYFEKHENEFWRRLSNWRDHQIVRKALRLAGNPKTVLDTPCGTGRFWDVLAEIPDRVIYASDYSQNMIDVGMTCRSPDLTRRVQPFQASAFDLPVPENFVESILCIRFMHHLANPEDRLKLLTEFHRVVSDTVIVSLWVDGNLKAWIRNAREKKRSARHKYQNRLVIPVKVIEQEFQQCGFVIEARLDFLKYYHMWRTYVLRKVPIPQ